MTPPDAKADTSGVRTVALVTAGRHGVSGRLDRAREDARAVEMGLEFAGDALTLVHAGDAQEPALIECLRGYLGMYHGFDMAEGHGSGGGWGRLDLLPTAPSDDAVPMLAEWLEAHEAKLVLTGQRAECGEGSGLLPYLLAERLGWAVVTGVAAIESVDGETVTLLQALPQGQRRRLTVTLPCLVAVDAVAPAPRQSAFGPARRGRVDVVETDQPAPDADRASWQFMPARARPKRLKVVKSTNARDRFKAAAAKSAASGGQVLSDLTADQAADRLIDYLRREKVIAAESDR